MAIFADRLIAAVRKKGSPCVVGLDPRIELMPDFIKSGRGPLSRLAISATISDFHELVLDAVADLVPAVKPQLAFYEQYGFGGIEAYENTVNAARARGLLVIADAKRNDISSTAEAYATAFLSGTAFYSDSMTVTPYLGRDSLEPFVKSCAQHGKGLFVVLKTSNRGSRDFQDQQLASSGRPLYESIAAIIEELGKELVGESGYSSIGAVVGATFPEDGRRLRELMPRTIILVPGYGAQGGTAEAAAACFHENGLGAVVSSSRGITYAHSDPGISRSDFIRAVRDNTRRMMDAIVKASSAPTPAR
ncbi:MAG TPA: orotidine-5'-phosphate decarboxylase [Bryobacteraceae bacterium]|nr:orotidine-5'-phosphate decarboxylase [Bryobacteraceae bacterium]